MNNLILKETNYEYSEFEYEELSEALDRTESVNYQAPDQFQYHQNQLSKAIARFLLRPYMNRKR